MAALGNLASRCGFDDKTNEIICNQLIEHLTNSNIRRRLLLEPDLTLDKAVTNATQVESAVQAKTIDADDSVSVQAGQPHLQPSQKKNEQYISSN